MKNATTITLLCLAAALLIPGIAAADVMTSNGTGMGDTIHYRMDGSYWKNSFGGQLFITYQNTDYTTYCVELTQPLGTGQVTEVPAEDVLNNSGAIHMLYEMYNDQVSSNVEAAALQVAIWELLYEDGTDFDAASGDFRAWTVDYDIITTANSLLALVPDPSCLQPLQAGRDYLRPAGPRAGHDGYACLGRCRPAPPQVPPGRLTASAPRRFPAGPVVSSIGPAVCAGDGHHAANWPGRDSNPHAPRGKGF